MTSYLSPSSGSISRSGTEASAPAGTELLPLTHPAVGLGSNHTVHSIVGLVFLGAAAWLWFKKAQTRPQA